MPSRQRHASLLALERKAATSRYLRLGLDLALLSAEPLLVKDAMVELAWALRADACAGACAADVPLAMDAAVALRKVGGYTHAVERACAGVIESCPAKQASAHATMLKKRLVQVARDSRRSDCQTAKLPHTALVLCLARLQDPRDLAAATCVSRSWREAGSHDALWTALLAARGSASAAKAAMNTGQPVRDVFRKLARKNGEAFVLSPGRYRCRRCRRFIWCAAGGATLGAESADACFGKAHVPGSAVPAAQAAQLTLGLGLDSSDSSESSEEDDADGGDGFWQRPPVRRLNVADIFR